MSLKAIWITIQTFFAGLAGWLAAYLGGLDGLVYALIIFVAADYLTGVLAAIVERRVSSAVGFRGISRKILIFTLIGLAHLLDMHVIGTPGVLRAATIFFYLSNEGISLIENTTRLGLPVPEQIRAALDAITRRDNTKPQLTNNSKEK
ncbi:phage holin family protein [Actinotignum sp. GS-2025e]|uniref:phage holin family protein n=1 Tax=Actinotignum sp. GS-2025e TaxID=3427278 RepID=UPI003F47648D